MRINKTCEFIQCLNIGIDGSEDYESILGCMWTCNCPEDLKMSSNEKGASETVKFLAADINHVGRLHG